MYALISVWSVPGLLVGPSAMGLIYDASSDYLAAYVTIGAVSLAGLLAVWGAGRPPKSP